MVAKPLSDQSFIRFGGLAGMLLALTSLASVGAYYAFVPTAQRQPVSDASGYTASLAHDSFGSQLFYGLYALIAVWALVGIIAVYYKLRAAGEAWAFFATLVGALSAVATIAAGVYQVAALRYLATLAPGAAVTAFNAPSPINPLGLMTFGLTGAWFLIVAFLLPRAGLPRLLALLSYVAFADLALGFVASVAGLGNLVVIAGLIAGVVGGPVFWAWLGALLWRAK